MKTARASILESLRELLRETTPPAEQVTIRLQRIERDVILPAKACFVLLLTYHLYFANWFENVALPQTDAQLGVQRFFVLYLLFNFAVAGMLIFWRDAPRTLTQRVLFTSNFTDGVLVSALAFMTGGVQSISYWLLLGLIARNAISCPLAVPQLVLNLSCSLCYVAASLIDLLFSRSVSDFEDAGSFPLEMFLLRILVLWLVAGWCYVLQMLLEKQRHAAEEAQEYAVRQEQLRAAGKLAGKIAHQIKNPLGIINNAAYSLARSLREGKPVNSQQVEIIREEVERADQTITQLMGYAKLAEGKVERIDVAEELDRALDLSVPAAARYPIEIERDYAPDLPPLLMQRSHLHESLVNLLTNAREAIVGKGRIQVGARLGPDQSVILSIADDGPGISKTKLGEIFQPYFTTKVKGTGLGLPIVKHNVEMYGGTIQVESELGKGTRFVLQFPTRTVTKQTT